MATVNFTRHFILVTLAALILLLESFLSDWEYHLPSFFLVANFLFYGAIYGVVLVFSLSPRSFVDTVLFVLLSACVSQVSPFLGMLTLGFLGEGALACASAIGALAYAMLVSYFWLPQLKVRLAVLAVPLCALATQTVVLLPKAISFAFGEFFIFTVAWWYTFSLSLWISHRWSANKSFKADAVNGAA